MTRTTQELRDGLGSARGVAPKMKLAMLEARVHKKGVSPAAPLGSVDASDCMAEDVLTSNALACHHGGGIIASVCIDGVLRRRSDDHLWRG